MNYNDLCEEICALGFEGDTEYNDTLLFCIRRALNTIYTERPVYRTAVLYKKPIATAEKIKDFSHSGGSENKISFSAKAYSFITSGTGRYEIEDPAGKREHEFSGDRVIHKGFLYGSGEIKFVGEFFYTVYDFATFSDIYGPSEEAIPLASEYTEYDLRKHIGDFLSPASLPTDDTGCTILGSFIRAGVMFIPNGYSGKIFLSYKKAPDRLSGNPDEEVILPDGCEHLAPLLAAAYFWLDDDSEKSQYYMSLYRDGMAAVRIHGPTHISNSYLNTNGWA